MLAVLFLIVRFMRHIYDLMIYLFMYSFIISVGLKHLIRERLIKYYTMVGLADGACKGDVQNNHSAPLFRYIEILLA